jgi:hypothetical protein
MGEVAEAAEEIVIDEEKEKALKTDTLLFIPFFFLHSQAPYLSTGYSVFL